MLGSAMNQPEVKCVALSKFVFNSNNTKPHLFGPEYQLCNFQQEGIELFPSVDSVSD